MPTGAMGKGQVEGDAQRTFEKRAGRPVYQGRREVETFVDAG